MPDKPMEHKLVEAMEGHEPAENPAEEGTPKPGSTPREVAEQARMKHDARQVDRTREQRLIDVGRAEDTNGR
ncbi:hypothetical protein P12x_005739 [Tundrisphaera lichenicola]|uniref:hypothetical protein n=1 Tax=Tundrisphaera lichenicola TaxID=2029860 RepID=UPI003EBD5AAB